MVFIRAYDKVDFRKTSGDRSRMKAVIPFPDIAPEIFSITIFGFELALRWYALAYLAGIILGWRFALRAVSRPKLWPNDQPPMTKEQVDDLLTFVILGIVVGGRLGYVFFYKFSEYMANPGNIIRVWDGGMAFHGGFLGVALAGFYFVWRHKIPTRSLADILALGTPAGLFFGRIANFINAELWGRPTDLPWGVVFPGQAAQNCGQPLTELCARHPSQLYEAGLEGLLLGLVIWVLIRRGALKTPGLIAGVFLVGYAVARLFVELFRQADAQFITAENPLGRVFQLTDTFGLSMGQLLSVPMIAVGLWLILSARRA